MSLGRRRHRLILSSPFFSISSSDLYFVVVTIVDSGRTRPVARVSTVSKITWRAQQLTVVGEMECWLAYLCVCAPNVSHSLSESSTAVAAAATSRICLFLIDWGTPWSAERTFAPSLAFSIRCHWSSSRTAAAAAAPLLLPSVSSSTLFSLLLVCCTSVPRVFSFHLLLGGGDGWSIVFFSVPFSLPPFFYTKEKQPAAACDADTHTHTHTTTLVEKAASEGL